MPHCAVATQLAWHSAIAFCSLPFPWKRRPQPTPSCVLSAICQPLSLLVTPTVPHCAGRWSPSRKPTHPALHGKPPAASPRQHSPLRSTWPVSDGAPLCRPCKTTSSSTGKSQAAGPPYLIIRNSPRRLQQALCPARPGAACQTSKPAVPPAARHSSSLRAGRVHGSGRGGGQGAAGAAGETAGQQAPCITPA